VSRIVPMIGLIRGFNSVERCLLATGAVLLSVFAAAWLHRSVGSRMALADFERARAMGEARASGVAPRLDGTVDFTLWSEKRILAYRESLMVHKGTPLGVLKIGRLGIVAPVVEGTDDLALNRGVGWIVGTARPGEPGNIGIAGHRDGFFRALKGVLPGDRIELETLRSIQTYVVDQTEIVTPDDVRVLRPRAAPSVTLVTCYPFYFMGDAPQRFIVHAALQK
jgi:sortase A